MEEADVSSAGYLFALSALSGEEICISNLNKDTLSLILDIGYLRKNGM